MHADAIIIGSGIHGCSAALHLAKAGIKPLVLEQSYPGRHASGVNAGGVRRLGRHFAEIPLSVESLKLWISIGDLVGSDCGFSRCGQIKVAESEQDMNSLKMRVKQLQSMGYYHEELIDRDRLRELLPAVSDHCCGAILCRDDGFALPFQTVQAFRRSAERAGARFKCGHHVSRLVRKSTLWNVYAGDEHFAAPIVINCAGAWAGDISRQMGEAVPLQAVAPMLMITERVSPFCAAVVGATSRALSFKQFENGTVLIGGGYRGKVDIDHRTTLLDMSGLAVNAATAEQLFPIMQGIRVVRCWAGIEALMPDEIPVISPSSRYPDAYHVFGFSAHGFQLGPITGKIVTDLIMHNSTTLPIEAFSIQRFARAC